MTLYIGIQMNAQDHGMLADLREAISGLKDPYREAWLEEATPYRLPSALMRFDAEWLLLAGGAAGRGGQGPARLEQRANRFPPSR